MKENLSKLMALSIDGKIDPNDFYHISVTQHAIRLQGEVNFDVMQKYKDVGFKFSINDESDSLDANDGNVYIIFFFSIGSINICYIWSWVYNLLFIYYKSFKLNIMNLELKKAKRLELSIKLFGLVAVLTSFIYLLLYIKYN